MNRVFVSVMQRLNWQRKLFVIVPEQKRGTWALKTRSCMSSTVQQPLYGRNLIPILFYFSSFFSLMHLETCNSLGVLVTLVLPMWFVDNSFPPMRVATIVCSLILNSSIIYVFRFHLCNTERGLYSKLQIGKNVHGLSIKEREWWLGK